MLWTPPNRIAIGARVFRRSSAVEQLTVNQLVVGSIPTVGAKNPNKYKVLGKHPARGLSVFLSGVTSGVTDCSVGNRLQRRTLLRNNFRFAAKVHQTAVICIL
jgi:hypothetical protein